MCWRVPIPSCARRWSRRVHAAAHSMHVVQAAALVWPAPAWCSEGRMLCCGWPWQWGCPITCESNPQSEAQLFQLDPCSILTSRCWPSSLFRLSLFLHQSGSLTSMPAVSGHMAAGAGPVYLQARPLPSAVGGAPAGWQIRWGQWESGGGSAHAGCRPACRLDPLPSSRTDLPAGSRAALSTPPCLLL